MDIAQFVEPLYNNIIIIIIKKSARSNRVQLWKTKFNITGKM